MPFMIRPFHRFPVCGCETYDAGLFEGHGTIWNLSLNGWRLSGDLPLRVGETCSFTITRQTNRVSMWLRPLCGEGEARRPAWNRCS